MLIEASESLAPMARQLHEMRRDERLASKQVARDLQMTTEALQKLLRKDKIQRQYASERKILHNRKLIIEWCRANKHALSNLRLGNSHLLSRLLRRLNYASAPSCPTKYKRCTSLHYPGHMANHEERSVGSFFILLSEIRQLSLSRATSWGRELPEKDSNLH